MEETSHQLFSIYKRKESPYFYAQFWDEKLRDYSPGRSTKKITYKEAEKICQTWLCKYGGLPPLLSHKEGMTAKKLISCMRSYLKDNALSSEAESLSIDALLSKVSMGLNGIDINQDNPILADFLLEFWDWDKSPYIKDKLESGQRIGKTYCKANKRYIEIYVVPYFQDMRIRSVSTYTLEQFKNSLPRKREGSQEGLCFQSINSIIGTISTALNEAKRLSIIQENPASNMRRLHSKKRERGILSKKEAETLFDTTWIDERCKVASQVAACHGLREGEIGALCIQDLDIEKNIEPITIFV